MNGKKAAIIFDVFFLALNAFCYYGQPNFLSAAFAGACAYSLLYTLTR